MAKIITHITMSVAPFFTSSIAFARLLLLLEEDSEKNVYFFIINDTLVVNLS